MKALSRAWRGVYGRDAEKKLRDPKRVFREISRQRRMPRRRPHPAKLRRLYRQAKTWALCATGAVAVYLALSSTPWSLTTALRHLLSSPNCDAARAVGLAPATQDEPGYWPRHDRDGDGIACEPWPRRRY